MAKKKDENKLSYLQMPLPSGRKTYKMTKRSWCGLNYRQTIDSGALSMEKNISTLEAPYLVPSQSHPTIDYANDYDNAIGIFGFDDILLVIYRDSDLLKVDYLIWNEEYYGYDTYTGILKEGADEDDEYPRCVVQFNHYEESDDIVNGTYKKRLLIFPDKVSMFFELDDLLNDENNAPNVDFTLYPMDVTIKKYTNKKAPYLPPVSADQDCYYQNTHACEETNDGTAIYQYCQYEEDGELKYGWKITVPPSFPNIKYATVHLSRLFGVSDDAVYASGFNDYSNWNLDSVASYNESNAWCSKAQSNTKADGNFTGITNFQGHVVCFKHDFMHEIYNTKNPFRINDVYAEGAIDNRTIQDVDGKLIFVSEDNVKIYTGANPRIIGNNLNMPKYEHAVSGTDGRCYYLYCKDSRRDVKRHRLFVYDTYTDCWSEQDIDAEIVGFAHTKRGMFYLCKDSSGHIRQLDAGGYPISWSFETDLITNETVSIKHIKKIQMLADIGASAGIKVYMLYDDEVFNKDTSHLVYESTTSGLTPIRVKPRQTANYGIKLHVEGKYYVKLYEMELFIESGGELYA